MSSSSIKTSIFDFDPGGRWTVVYEVCHDVYLLAFDEDNVNQPGHRYISALLEPESALAVSGRVGGFNYANLDAGWSFLIPMSSDGAKIRTYQKNNLVVDKPAGMAPAFTQGGFRWGTKAGWHGVSDGAPKTGTWEETDVLHNRLANSPNNEWSGWIGAAHMVKKRSEVRPRANGRAVGVV